MPNEANHRDFIEGAIKLLEFATAFKAILSRSKNQEDFLKTAVYRYVHKWSPLLRKSNDSFIAAPIDVHFVLICHIKAKNDQFCHDQEKCFSVPTKNIKINDIDIENQSQKLI